MLRYRNQLHFTQLVEPSYNESVCEIGIQSWKEYPMIAPDEEQEIGLQLLSATLQFLTLNIERDSTGLNEESESQLSHLVIKRNTLVPNRACLDMSDQQRNYKKESYLYGRFLRLVEHVNKYWRSCICGLKKGEIWFSCRWLACDHRIRPILDG
jgi:hypothetical protein